MQHKSHHGLTYLVPSIVTIIITTDANFMHYFTFLRLTQLTPSVQGNLCASSPFPILESTLPTLPTLPYLFDYWLLGVKGILRCTTICHRFT